MIEQKLVTFDVLNEHLADGWLVKIAAPRECFIIEREKKDPLPELKPEDLMKPLLDDITDDEILYYATPYYDMLQAQKEQRAKQLKDEELTRGQD